MKTALYLALRNIGRHKFKTLIISSIIIFGAIIMTVGLSIISGFELGLKENIVNNFSGDIVLLPQKQENNSVFFGTTEYSLEAFYNYPTVKKYLSSHKNIDKFLPLGVGTSFRLNENGFGTFIFLIGVDFSDYINMFPNSINIIEGNKFKSIDKGIFISQNTRTTILESNKTWLLPRNYKINKDNLPKGIYKVSELTMADKIIILGNTNTNTSLDILIPVQGIFKYRSLNKFFGIFNFIDINSFRETMGYYTSSNTVDKLDVVNTSLLNMKNESLEKQLANLIPKEKKQTDFFNISSKFKKKVVKVENGAYNIVLIKLKPGVKLKDEVVRLNRDLIDRNIDLKAITWIEALGKLGMFSKLMKVVLLAFVSILFIVAIIIIMNTISISVLNRSTEIGTMKAIGVKDKFIHRIFLFESLILSVGIGLLGILIGYILTYFFSKAQLVTENPLLQILCGGDTFLPQLVLRDYVLCILQLFIVSILSIIYPFILIHKISPLDAMPKE